MEDKINEYRIYWDTELRKKDRELMLWMFIALINVIPNIINILSYFTK